MALPRRAAAAIAAPKPVATGVNFLDLGMYSGGFGIPAGQYALEFTVQMFAGTKANGTPTGSPRLGVMIHAYSLSDTSHQGDNAYTQFLSMGSNADKSFVPNETGKGLSPVSGAVGGNLSESTNWALFLRSLFDCGLKEMLPEGSTLNDIGILDGVWVNLAQIPEPEERKSFASKTAEVQEERKAGKIPVITEILDNGKPWEGTGGIPNGAVVSAPVKVNGAPAVALPVAAAAKTVATPAATSGIDEADILNAAISGATEVIDTDANRNGMAYLPFRTGTFQAVNKAYGDAVAQAVTNTYFVNDTAVNVLLNSLGYQKTGNQIKTI